MAIQFNKSASPTGNVAQRKERVASTHKVAGSNPAIVSRFTNTTNNGLKVKMPDSVHIFLPGETIEFIEKDLGTDGAQKELDRRARRHALKSKASVEWKRNKGKK